MNTAPFSPSGNSMLMTASTTAPTPVLLDTADVGGTQYRIHNSGGAMVFLGFGDTPEAALAMASPNISGSTITLVPSSVEVFTLPCNQYFTGLTLEGSSDVYILAGDGA